MQKTILFIFTLLVSSTTYAGVDSKDIEKFLPGSWHTTAELPEYKIESKATYYRDKTCAYTISVTTQEGKTIISAKGTWKAEGDTLVVKITHTNSPDTFKPGEIMRDKVTFIDSKQFTYTDEEGTVTTEYRQK
ncbi:MAG: hypothetical protein OEZ39_16050 [Gammaproteobacteria bacterium]|nr:hypothetical protein [Gammaproteobacteria bacterium]